VSPEHPDAETRAIDAALRQWIENVPAGFQASSSSAAERFGLTAEGLMTLEAQFEKLALDLFAYQFERVPLYRAYARAQGRTPSQVRRAAQVPALPVEALRRERVASFAAAHEVKQFRTSGTTGAPGVLHLDSLALYDLTLARGFAHHVVPDVDRIRLMLLLPGPEESPHSSLTYMLERVRQRWGTRESRFYIVGGQLSWPELRRDLWQAAASQEPVCLAGTTFALVSLLDTCAQQAWRVELPAGSRIFETGGTKGRTREIARSELLRSLHATLGVPTAHVVSEYGMTELASQYYTLSLRAALLGKPLSESAPTWSSPFWLRPRLVEAESGEALDVSEAADIGLMTHHDLGNRGTVAHWLTADLASPWRGSFLLHGRAPHAEARGCGLVHEHLLPAGDNA
jgi:hypothetical protein